MRTGVQIVLCIVLGAAAQAQESEFLREKVAEKAPGMQARVEAAFQGLLLYPKEVRDAALEIAQQPELVVKVLNVAGGDDKRLLKVVANYPENVQRAARVMNKYLEVLSIMEQDLATTAIVGRIYGEQKAAIVQVLDRLAEKARQASAESAKAWAAELTKDPNAAAELAQAGKDFATATGSSPPGPPPVEGGEANVTTAPVTEIGEYGYPYAVTRPYYGYYVTDDGVLVYDVPYYPLTYYVLWNADRYPYLSDLILRHHHRYGNYAVPWWGKRRDQGARASCAAGRRTHSPGRDGGVRPRAQTEM